MGGAEHEHGVQTRPPDAPDHPRRRRMLPRTPWGRTSLRSPHTRDASGQDGAIDRIPVAEEIPGCVGPRARRHQVLRRPRGGRRLRHGAVANPPPRMREHEEPEAPPQAARGDGEEGPGDARGHVSLPAGPPRRCGRPMGAAAVFLDRGCGPSTPPFLQLSKHAGRAPRGLRHRQGPAQGPAVRTDRRPARGSLAPPGPGVPTPPALPRPPGWPAGRSPAPPASGATPGRAISRQSGPGGGSAAAALSAYQPRGAGARRHPQVGAHSAPAPSREERRAGPARWAAGGGIRWGIWRLSRRVAWCRLSEGSIGKRITNYREGQVLRVRNDVYINGVPSRNPTRDFEIASNNSGAYLRG